MNIRPRKARAQSGMEAALAQPQMISSSSPLPCRPFPPGINHTRLYPHAGPLDGTDKDYDDDEAISRAKSSPTGSFNSTSGGSCDW